MSYHHLTISERIRIEVLSILGYSTRFIAKFLHRHHSTIARELSCNKFENEYVSTSAHNKYLERRKNSSHSNKFTNLENTVSIYFLFFFRNLLFSCFFSFIFFLDGVQNHIPSFSNFFFYSLLRYPWSAKIY